MGSLVPIQQDLFLNKPMRISLYFSPAIQQPSSSLDDVLLFDWLDATDSAQSIKHTIVTRSFFLIRT